MIKHTRLRELLILIRLSKPYAKNSRILFLECLLYPLFIIHKRVWGYYVDNELKGFVIVGSKWLGCSKTIGHLFVDPTYRSNGAGTKLLEHAEQVLISEGYTVSKVRSLPRTLNYYAKKDYDVAEDKEIELIKVLKT